ncbi:unnamed protein product, partial [marine sediment metagenome]
MLHRLREGFSWQDQVQTAVAGELEQEPGIDMRQDAHQ